MGGKIATEQQQPLDIVILTLNDSLVAYFVASLDILPCKEMLAMDCCMILDAVALLEV